jgi:hypothetical protein
MDRNRISWVQTTANAAETRLIVSFEHGLLAYVGLIINKVLSSILHTV